MPETVGYDEMVRMLRGGAEKVTAQHQHLSKLDAAIGDGDHGTAMRKAMSLLARAVAGHRARDMSSVLSEVGWAVLGAGGGSTGPLFGTFFMGMAEATGDKASLDAPALAGVFENALASVRKQTKAEPGDKTMLDALIPAVETMRASADAGRDPAGALADAADAARQGAEATTDMQARFGRARNLGERSKGTPDPGATSVALMFRGFADALAVDEN
jgi:dihydroxyacetone kinase phosphoprotein-dependent L subunit